MKTLFGQFIILVLLIISCSAVNSQQKIEIRRSGFLNFDEENYPGARILTRDDSEQVHIFHNGTDMWCDKAYYYGNENSIEAFGNVKMGQGDTINMTSKYVQYSGETQLAFASGNVVLTNPDSKITTDTLYFDRERQHAFYRSSGTVQIDTSGTIVSKIGRYYANEKKYKFVEDVVLTNPDAKIETNYFDFYDELKHAYLFGPSTITTEESVTYCEKGFYNTEAKTGYAMKNAKINYDGKEILGDSIYFDQNRNFSSATNNIKITDTLNKSIVKGHYAEVFKAKDSIFITKRALAITLQEKDSIYIHGDTLMVTGKPEKRITRAFRNVKLFKSDLSGKADSIHANHATGLTQLININKSGTSGAFSTARKPILWNLGNQMTGDTIHLQSDIEKDKLDSLIVFNHAFLISKDTLGTGFNQINGKKLVGLFNEENEIYNVDILKNAQVIYYLRNENGELTGIDKSKSGLINIKINDNTIEEVRKINQIDGKVYPESQFPKNEKILKGFDWREEEQPSSVDDLFKDDPPLELPTILGLDDYVPEDDFFEDSLKMRLISNKIRSIGSTEKVGNKKNLLVSTENFNSKKWYNKNLSVNYILGSTPNGNKKYVVLNGLNGLEDCYITQQVANQEGDFIFTIWLKGNGEIKIGLQEAGNDYSYYQVLDLKLTDNWTKYKLNCTKEEDLNPLRVIIRNINPQEKVHLYNPILKVMND